MSQAPVVQLPVAQHGIEHLCADEEATKGPSEASRQIVSTAANNLRGRKTCRRRWRSDWTMMRKAELMVAILS